MEQDQYLLKYEHELLQHLLRVLSSMQLLDGQLLETQDVNDQWEHVAQSYVADAVKEIANYPSVALGWAMYLGMAIACYWDDDWKVYGKVPNLYEYLRDKRGFDFLDEVVRGDVLMLKDEAYDQMEKTVQSCAQQTLARIRHEQIEPQSPLAFHVYICSIRVLYRLGAAMELKRKGYNYSLIDA